MFKVNFRSFCSLNGVKLDSKKALEYFNNGKDRIRELSANLWLIEDFFVFQYGETFNPNNRLHDSVEKLYNKHDLKMTSIRGLKDLKDRVKDKDKDNNNSIEFNTLTNQLGYKENRKKQFFQNENY